MNPSEISNDIGNDIGNDSNVNLQEQETESYAQQNIILPSGDKEDATQIYNLDYYTSQSIIENNLNFSNEINDRIDNNDDKPWKRASKDPSLIQRGSELFIGNISSETSEEDLFNLFAECGEIIDIRIHRNTQTKKCYAFVRFMNREMIKRALNKNMTTLLGRKIKVTKSNENSTIFIGNIRKNWSNADVETKVRRIFHNCEKVEHFPDPLNSLKNRGFCFVIFKNRNEAIKALNYVQSKGGINIDGVPLTCDWADVVEDEDSNSKQIFISGLNECVSESSIRDYFSKYGKVVEVVLSRDHKNSKRKDLAFVTFDTQDEAKYALDCYNKTKPNELTKQGYNLSVSLAFSQQAVQSKKKFKEARKKLNVNPSTSSVVPQVSVPLPQTVTYPANLNQNTNTTLLAMMNMINMNKLYSNINPNMLTQMMTACMESVVQNQNTNNNTTIHNNNIPANSNTNPLGNNFSTLNFNQGLNLDPYNSFNNKRLKKVIPKKRRNNTNVSADLNPY